MKINIFLFSLILSFSLRAEVATFAGGCFWCMEPPYENLDGVLGATSGYMGGAGEDATYDKVSRGNTGHLEVVQIEFDPKKISYEKLLETFWRNINPTQSNGQFVDRGSQYASAIFYHSIDQKILAELSKKKLEKSKKFDKPIVTKIIPASKFYRAENYHQDFYKKSSERYKNYKKHSGRESFIKKYWKSN